MIKTAMIRRLIRQLQVCADKAISFNPISFTTPFIEVVQLPFTRFLFQQAFRYTRSEWTRPKNMILLLLFWKRNRRIRVNAFFKQRFFCKFPLHWLIKMFPLDFIRPICLPDLADNDLFDPSEVLYVAGMYISISICLFVQSCSLLEQWDIDSICNNSRLGLDSWMFVRFMQLHYYW